MSKRKIENKGVFIYLVILFVISVSLVVFIFPRKEQFQYSYEPGTPWLYESLVAETDFPIYKTEDEIALEKDSVVKNFIPHYIKDSSAIEKYKYLMQTKIEEILDSLKTRSNKIFILSTTRKQINTLENFYKEFETVNATYYNRGIIELSEFDYNNKLEQVYFDKNGTSELTSVNNFYTKSEFSKALLDIYDKCMLETLDSVWCVEIQNFISPDYIPANIVYNQELNEKEINEEIDNLSPILGVIQAGQVIVRKGNIIGDYECKVLNSMQNYMTKDLQHNTWSVSLGILLVFVLLFSILFVYFLNFSCEIMNSFKTSSFFSIQILIMILTVYLVFQFTDFSINNIPFVLFPLLILTFYKFRVSFFVYLFTLFIVGFFAPSQFEFLIIQTLAGLAAMFSLRKSQKRQHIVVTVLIVFGVYVVLNLGFSLMKGKGLGLEFINELKPFAVSSFLVLLYLPFVYILEKAFGLVSDYTLLELSDINHPALRLLSEQAPGTFQHSMQVSNLAESVVNALGGNSILTRVGALYHDIGKISHAEYFIENQSGVNIHNELDFEESATKIISHVKEGMLIAKKYNLPSQVADFIETHHGTSLTKYFYVSWVNANPGLEPNMLNFKYPGPKPHSIETAVLMMADAIEAASRTLQDYTVENIQNTVSNIIDSQLNDGQFNEVSITLEQITKAKKIFAEKIKNIYHARIVYPEINSKD